MEINKKLEDLFSKWIEKCKETSLALEYANINKLINLNYVIETYDLY